MKNIFLFVSALLISGSFSLEAENAIDENSAAIKLSQQLTENLETSPLNLKVRKLTMKGTQFSSEFADNLLTLIKHELKRNTDDFPSVGGLMRGLRGNVLTVLPNKDEDPQAKDAFLEGIYRIVSDNVVVEMSLKDSNGKSVSNGEVSLPRTKIKHKLEPPNINIAQESEEVVTSTVAQHSKDFSIKLRLNKDEGAIFREGDNLSIFFRSEENTYLLLLYQDAHANRYILYPETKAQRKTPLIGGKEYELFKKGDLRIQCDPVCGAEMVWAFASEIPVKTTEATEDLNGSGLSGYPASFPLSKILGKQRSIRKKKSEDRIILTTVPNQ